MSLSKSRRTLNVIERERVSSLVTGISDIEQYYDMHETSPILWFAQQSGVFESHEFSGQFSHTRFDEFAMYTQIWIYENLQESIDSRTNFEMAKLEWIISLFPSRYFPFRFLTTSIGSRGYRRLELYYRISTPGGKASYSFVREENMV